MNSVLRLYLGIVINGFSSLPPEWQNAICDYTVERAELQQPENASLSAIMYFLENNTVIDGIGLKDDLYHSTQSCLATLNPPAVP